MIAEEPQQMANVFVAVAILGVFATIAERARVICLVNGGHIMNIENELMHKACNIDLFTKRRLKMSQL